MIDFIDKTSEQSGTPLNRENLMAVQGFIAQTTVFNDDGSITDVFVGEKTITLNTIFENNQLMQEVIE